MNKIQNIKIIAHVSYIINKFLNIKPMKTEELLTKNSMVSLLSLNINHNFLVNRIVADPHSVICIDEAMSDYSCELIADLFIKNKIYKILENKQLATAILSIADRMGLNKDTNPPFQQTECDCSHEKYVYLLRSEFSTSYAVMVGLFSFCSKEGYLDDEKYAKMQALVNLITKNKILLNDLVFPQSFIVDMDQDFDNLQQQYCKKFSTEQSKQEHHQQETQMTKEEQTAAKVAQKQMKNMYKSFKKLLLQAYKLNPSNQTVHLSLQKDKQMFIGLKQLIEYMSLEQNKGLFNTTEKLVQISQAFENFENFEQYAYENQTMEQLGELLVAFNMLKKTFK